MAITLLIVATNFVTHPSQARPRNDGGTILTMVCSAVTRCNVDVTSRSCRNSLMHASSQASPFLDTYEDSPHVDFAELIEGFESETYSVETASLLACRNYLNALPCAGESDEEIYVTEISTRSDYANIENMIEPPCEMMVETIE